VTFYGLADSRLIASGLGEVVEFYVSRAEAEQARRDVLVDEPNWESEINVVEVDLGGIGDSVGETTAHGPMTISQIVSTTEKSTKPPPSTMRSQ
jgi:hypothetical protein